MNISILIANILTLLAFFIHMFMGDKELKVLQPPDNAEDFVNKQEKWTMVRCGWHWISLDLLFASIGLAVINFTNYLDCETTLLKIISIYFLGYAIVWIIVILISKKFDKNFIKLGQWILLLAISCLIYFGIDK